MTEPKSGNITWHASGVSRAERERKRGHRGATLWLTGLSGSGKSTVATLLEQKLLDRGCAAYVLDGDNVRYGLNRDLGFSPEDRSENIRRIGEVAKLFTDAGVIVLCAFISPYRADRDRVRQNLAAGDFVEIYVKASLAACEARDPKGLYKKARAGGISDMTGISSPYEEPLKPELVVDTEQSDLAACVSQVLGFLEKNGYIGLALASAGLT
ncbi:MAG TPA: adenylyl-sulfate kinase [Polyangiales bacterium]|jgi:adenylylsulfate kinase|nr:adenylyl-sulfate kinase [Polyangiales bacterium]